MRSYVGVLFLAAAGSAFGQVTVPNAYDSTFGPGGFLYMVTTGRTYQYQIHEDQLTGLVGQNLNGLQWRSLSSATTVWPPVDATFNNFDIFIGPGVDPATRSFTYASNFSGPVTQVRSGSLTLPGGSFGFGSTSSWGPTVTFDNYLYTGGHLTIEMRHNGMLGTTSTRSFDAITTTTSGYLTQFSAIWNGTYNGTTGANGNFFVTRLTASPVPEPATMAVLGLGAAALIRRRKRA
jgi:hypothetical protein